MIIEITKASTATQSNFIPNDVLDAGTTSPNIYLPRE